MPNSTNLAPLRTIETDPWKEINEELAPEYWEKWEMLSAVEDRLENMDRIIKRYRRRRGPSHQKTLSAVARKIDLQIEKVVLEQQIRVLESAMAERKREAIELEHESPTPKYPPRQLTCSI